MCYAQPRYTKDIDLLINIAPNSAQGCINALIEFGLQEEQINKELFFKKGNFFKIGQEPWRIDLITSVEGMEFSEIYSRSNMIELHGLTIPVISKNDLISVKTLAARPQDLLDVETLKKSKG